MKTRFLDCVYTMETEERIDLVDCLTWLRPDVQSSRKQFIYHGTDPHFLEDPTFADRSSQQDSQRTNFSAASVRKRCELGPCRYPRPGWQWGWLCHSAKDFESPTRLLPRGAKPGPSESIPWLLCKATLQ